MKEKYIKILQEKLNSAEAVVIGAGAGLSTAAGYEYSGKKFSEYFDDFERKYNFHNMYSGGFYPYDSQEEFWAYWSRYIFLNRYHDAPIPVYDDLFKTVKDKNYFVITTNVDHCFQKAGFEKERLFYTQGDFGLFQCSKPCHSVTYDNERSIREMIAKQTDMKIPSTLIPRCPKCGKHMMPNLRSDETFVEDEGWHAAASRYKNFIELNKDKEILFLELGVGFNTPVIIKYPFIKMTASYPNAFYACINKGEIYIPKEISDRAVGIDEDIGEVIKKIIKNCKVK